MRSKYAVVVGLIVLFLVGASLPSVLGAGHQEGKYPRLGFGGQFVYPIGGISGRYWINSSLGLESNAVFWTYGSGFHGTVSFRGLSKLTDNEIVNFYLAGGGGYNFDFRESPNNQPVTLNSDFALNAAGGISIQIFSPQLILNFELGMFFQTMDRFGPTGGTGLHFYFA